jgi:hypothetical protein
VPQLHFHLISERHARGHGLHSTPAHTGPAGSLACPYKDR